MVPIGQSVQNGGGPARQRRLRTSNQDTCPSLGHPWNVTGAGEVHAGRQNLPRPLLTKPLDDMPAQPRFLCLRAGKDASLVEGDRTQR